MSSDIGHHPTVQVDRLESGILSECKRKFTHCVVDDGNVRKIIIKVLKFR